MTLSAHTWERIRIWIAIAALTIIAVLLLVLAPVGCATSSADPSQPSPPLSLVLFHTAVAVAETADAFTVTHLSDEELEDSLQFTREAQSLIGRAQDAFRRAEAARVAEIERRRAGGAPEPRSRSTGLSGRQAAEAAGKRLEGG